MSARFRGMLTRFEQWPERDRALWDAAFVKRSVLAKRAYGSELRSRTLRFVRQAYGRWLSALAAAGTLDPIATPGARATPENLDLFVQVLQGSGNIDNTIAARIRGLQQALQIMQPGEDFSWLGAPGGTSINSLFRAVPRQLFTPDAMELYDWGFELIAAATRCDHDQRRQSLHRDGLMIAILACRAPRMRTLAAMELGRHVNRNGDVYRLNFEDEDLKVNKPIAYDLPKRMTQPIERYLAVERVGLLASATHKSFWVGHGGAPLGEPGIYKIIRTATQKRFGEGFGTHRFRHALMTTWAKRDPAHLAAASAILGNTGPVADKYYNHAKQIDAARRANASLELDREETRAEAERFFAQRH